jgi:3-methyl-2-oxobutanoate hydroxymethyltransferase
MSADRAPVTVPRLARTKVRRGDAPIVMVTAYDVHSARLADEAGVDVILVGDSLGMVVQGGDTTLEVTIEDVAYHLRCVARAKPSALVVGDMPWLSYHVSEAESVRNAGRLVQHGRAAAVKVEGGLKRVAAVRAILDAEIPVMGHVGLTPQSVHAMGGYRVQGKDAEAAQRILDDARALEDAGVFSIVLEGVPEDLAERITEAVEVPTIGIGAGSRCDGQVLVWHDLLGLTPAPSPKFVRRYEEIGARATEAIRRFADDVRAGRFPSDAETYHGAASPSRRATAPRA